MSGTYRGEGGGIEFVTGVCDACGSLVVDQPAHDAWHAALAPKPRWRWRK